MSAGRNDEGEFNPRINKKKKSNALRIKIEINGEVENVLEGPRHDKKVVGTINNRKADICYLNRDERNHKKKIANLP